MRHLCLARGCDDERLEGSWFCQMHQPLAKVYQLDAPPPSTPHPVHHEDSKRIERSVEWITVILFVWVIGLTLFLIGQEVHIW